MSNQLVFIVATAPLPATAPIIRDFAAVGDVVREVARNFFDDAEATVQFTPRLWEHTTLLSNSFKNLRELLAQFQDPSAGVGAFRLSDPEPPRHYWPTTYLLPVQVGTDKPLPPLAVLPQNRVGTVLPANVAEVFAKTLSQEIVQTRIMTLPEMLAVPLYESPSYADIAALLEAIAFQRSHLVEPKPGYLAATDGKDIVVGFHSMTTFERATGNQSARAYAQWRNEIARLQTVLVEAYGLHVHYARATAQFANAARDGENLRDYLLDPPILVESKPLPLPEREYTAARISHHTLGGEVNLFYRVQLQRPNGTFDWSKTVFVADPQFDSQALRQCRIDLNALGLPIENAFTPDD